MRKFNVLNESTLETLKSLQFDELKKSCDVPATIISILGQLQADCISGRSKNVKEGLFYSQLVIDRSWEYLNIGNWKDVPDPWRFVYAYGCFFKIVYLNLSSDTFEELVATADRGLLMGLPIMGNVLARIACQCCRYLSQQSKSKEDLQVEKIPTLSNSNGDNSKTTLKLTELKVGISPGSTEVMQVQKPTIQWFLETVFGKQIPFVFQDCLNSWPALNEKHWTLSYLCDIAGHRTVPVEVGSKYTDESWSQQLVRFSDFVTMYIEKENPSTGYLAQHRLFDQVPELKNDIRIPEYCLFGDVEPEDIQINAWIGPKGTVSPLHFDPEHNFLCQVIGKKYIRLYSVNYTGLLYPHEGMLSNTSQVDILDPDESKFPLFSSAPYWECILSEGEMLYIPPKMWHYVKSLSTSVSVSFWWH
ncbi:lysine-specific demethylase 8-like isoform X1 [Artemia franciscana]|uniref:lysine-specific demethylase 8-like isoform X1 n=1 Tax=Artemia franciscana TaxID=6661 RepID=UPI0032D9CD90